MSPSDAETLFEGLVQRFGADPSVTVPSADGKGAFGASALKVDGRIFAMLSNGELVVKLPRERVDGLVTSGAGQPFDTGRGRVMKEWVAIALGDSQSWSSLAEEARNYVATAARRR